METTAYASSDALTGGFRHAIERYRYALLRPEHQSDKRLDFAASVADGLSSNPPKLDCRFLYDRRGSELFERITEQPEYYPTRTEASILRDHAREIPEITGPVTLVELGSGSSAKTHRLLSAYESAFEELSYVPVDVSESALRHAARTIAEEHPAVQVVAVNATYDDVFALVPEARPAMMMFLGSSIGNFDPASSADFWARVSHALPPGGFFLLGVDLVKDRRTLERAYDDQAGVTRAFTRNLFARMNRELGSEIDVEAVEHIARYREEREQIEIHARFAEPQEIEVSPLGRRFAFDAGERVLVEISRKFRLETLGPQLGGFGLEVRRVFTDSRRWFALLLLQRSDDDPAYS